MWIKNKGLAQKRQRHTIMLVSKRHNKKIKVRQLCACEIEIISARKNIGKRKTMSAKRCGIGRHIGYLKKCEEM